MPGRQSSGVFEGIVAAKARVQAAFKARLLFVIRENCASYSALSGRGRCNLPIGPGPRVCRTSSSIMEFAKQTVLPSACALIRLASS